MIVVPALEWHAAHSCNFSCEGCCHFNNYGYKEIISIDTLEKWFSLWNKRIAPQRLAVLGGEPLLNKDIIGIIELGRNMWDRQHGTYYEIVTNGFLLHRFPDLPRTLEKTNCLLRISVHGSSEKYMKKFNLIRDLVKEWQKEYKFEVVYDPDDLWFKPYLGHGENSLPYEENNPEKSWEHCITGQECFNLVDGNIFKCSLLAYLPLMKKVFPNLSNKWNPYLAYKPLTHKASDEEIKDFFNRKAETYCGMCSTEWNLFKKTDPFTPIKFYKKENNKS